MTIQFEKIQFKNILAVGNQFIEISFKSDIKNLFIGANGAGKSTMIEALFFVLYGKSFRKGTKNELVNITNKGDLEVDISLNSGSTHYRIHRGISPDFCDIYINAKKRDNIGAKDIQAFISDQILNISEKTFRQIVVLGSSAYVPFMKLPPNGRRPVVENLLDIGIFSVMAQIIKSQYSMSNQELSDFEAKAENIRSRIDILLKQKMLAESNTTDDKFESEKTSLAADIARFTDEITRLNDKLDEFAFDSGHLDDLVKSVQEYEGKRGILGHVIGAHERDIKFYENNDTCTRCSQDISTELAEKQVASIKTEIDEAAKEYDSQGDIVNDKNKIITEYKSFEMKTSKIDNLIQSRNQFIAGLENQISNIDKSVGHIADHSSATLSSVNADMDTESLALKAIMKQIREIKIHLSRLEYIIIMLKDDGIKSKIIKTYLPIINKLIRKYLDIMDFSADFQFDEMFKETIKVRGRDLMKYGMFSDGEKLRVDLAILFTWRELSRMKNSAATNLIIFDEIGDSSLDKDGFDAFMKVLAHEQEHQSIFIISHKPEELVSVVDKIYKFEKKNNFTTVT